MPEGGASFEQLQDLIKNECDKRDKKYRSLEQKYNKLQDSFDTSQLQKNLQTRGQRGTSNKKKLPAVSRRPVPNQGGRTTTTKTATTYGSSTIPSRTARKSR